MTPTAAPDRAKNDRLTLSIALLAALALGLLNSWQTWWSRSAANEHTTLWQALSSGMTAWLYWAAVSPLILKLAHRFPFRRDSWVRPTLIHTLSGFGLTVLYAVAIAGISWLIWEHGPTDHISRWFVSFLQSRLQFGVLIYGSVLALGLVLEYRRVLERRDRDAAELAAQLTRARLETLKARLHPHFLFNSLHAIGVLIQEDPEAATRTVTLLGDLLRATLDGADTDEVTLRGEVDLLRRYLAIELIRFPDRLHVAWAIEPNALDCRIPNLLLQPLVENAIRHGIGPAKDAGQIQLAAARRNGDLEIELWNDGRPLARQPDGTLREGIGLSTTRERLAKHYGAGASLELADDPRGGVRVSLTIPQASSPNG